MPVRSARRRRRALDAAPQVLGSQPAAAVRRRQPAVDQPCSDGSPRPVRRRRCGQDMLSAVSATASEDSAGCFPARVQHVPSTWLPSVAAVCSSRHRRTLLHAAFSLSIAGLADSLPTAIQPLDCSALSASRCPDAAYSAGVQFTGPAHTTVPEGPSVAALSPSFDLPATGDHARRREIRLGKRPVNDVPLDHAASADAGPAGSLCYLQFPCFSL